jgi:hypothetical protein
MSMAAVSDHGVVVAAPCLHLVPVPMEPPPPPVPMEVPIYGSLMALMSTMEACLTNVPPDSSDVDLSIVDDEEDGFSTPKKCKSRSKSSNSCFNSFILQKFSLVEFWLRFDTASECQRYEELKADNISIHSTPLLRTSLPMEKQGSILYKYSIFKNSRTK